jgi:iron-only hydrogenase group A
MKNVTLVIDGLKANVPAGTTILAAAETVGIDLPTLCHHPDLPPQSSCRICVVEIAGQSRLEPACSYPAAEGMEVSTKSDSVQRARRINLELLLAQHPGDCLTCSRNGSCELQELAARFGIKEISFAKRQESTPPDTSSVSILRDPDKCILCGRCRSVCISCADVLARVGRGYKTQIQPQFQLPLAQAGCVACGQCTLVCPTGALQEKEEMVPAFDLLAQRDYHTIVQVAPAVRVSIGEEFGLPSGSIATGQLVAALRRLGFQKVFDTNFTADVTILEEGKELLGRLKEGVLPMFTSCSPGWINFVEQYYPSLCQHLSTCKSPQAMFGALAKTYYAQKCGIPGERIRVVSAMPCTAKKMEAKRGQLAQNGRPDVDLVLTTRELGKMLRVAGIDLTRMPEEQFDSPFGIASGAAAIFGTTGGVMEAALRTVSSWLGEEGELAWIRGEGDLRIATVSLAGLKLKLAVVYGLARARELLDQLSSGTLPYDFVEVMCCPGGCIGGGGQSLPTTWQEREERAQALYEIDNKLKLSRSHENPAARALYSEFLGEVGGELAHRLLHTSYEPQPFASFLEK